MLPKKARMSTADMKGRSFLQRKFRFGTVKFFKTGAVRVGVVISKKVHAKAVDRNRTRRRIYNAVRDCLKQQEIRHSIVIYPAREALTAKFSELKASVVGAVTHPAHDKFSNTL